ncbi:MAG: AAA family ATPase [Bacteroidales bacterium]|nr:AAA family ATPase [Bacteroidales bacterium]
MSSHPNVERLIFTRFPHQPTQGQREACSLLVDFLFDADPHVAFLLKGYAGTGKTSLVSALIQTAPLLRLHTVLLAPTGRAAKVLSGYSGQQAYTIHKKIYMASTDASGAIRTVRAPNKHSYTLFIVDEASMIGLDTPDGGAGWARRNLLEDLLDYVADGNHCRLLLMGDGAQLPPVGAGESPALNAKYLESLSGLRIYEYELTEVVRQQHESGILHDATVLRNRLATLGPYEPVELPLFAEPDGTDVVRLPGTALEEVLQHEYSATGIEDVVLVTRSNKRANLFNQGIRNRVLYREEEINAGDYLMVVKNNYFWTDEASEMSFIANGDIVEVLGARNFQELYGFRFADATLRFVDYADAPTLDCKLLLDTLHSDSPSLSAAEMANLFNAVMEDYADLPHKYERLKAVKTNPYFNALQVKFAYALTCHKTQGGQWPTVFIDQGYITDDMLDKELLRWFYTAFTRATRKVYLINFEDKFFSDAAGE